MLESLFCLLVLFRSEVNVSTLQRVSTGVETKKMCVNFNRQFMEYYHKCANKRVHSKPLCILFSDTKGIQWADTDATVVAIYALKGDPCEFKANTEILVRIHVQASL